MRERSSSVNWRALVEGGRLGGVKRCMCESHPFCQHATHAGAGSSTSSIAPQKHAKLATGLPGQVSLGGGVATIGAALGLAGMVSAR